MRLRRPSGEGLSRGVRRGGDKEPTVKGGIKASQVSIRASWPLSSGIVEMERDGEGWRGMERDGERLREMEMGMLTEGFETDRMC